MWMSMGTRSKMRGTSSDLGRSRWLAPPRLAEQPAEAWLAIVSFNCKCELIEGGDSEGLEVEINETPAAVCQVGTQLASGARRSRHSRQRNCLLRCARLRLPPIAIRPSAVRELVSAVARPLSRQQPLRCVPSSRSAGCKSWAIALPGNLGEGGDLAGDPCCTHRPRSEPGQLSPTVRAPRDPPASTRSQAGQALCRELTRLAWRPACCS